MYVLVAKFLDPFYRFMVGIYYRSNLIMTHGPFTKYNVAAKYCFHSITFAQLEKKIYANILNRYIQITDLFIETWLREKLWREVETDVH